MMLQLVYKFSKFDSSDLASGVSISIGSRLEKLSGINQERTQVICYSNRNKPDTAQSI